MSQLQLSNVINISVSVAPAGVGAFNTSNLALFTRETPGAGFGSDGYKIYKSPSEVTTDFGSTANTSAMASAVFSQKPNILAGGGYLVVIPLEGTGGTQGAVVAQQRITFSGTPVSGTWLLNYDSDVTSALAYNIDAATLQTAVQTLTGLGSATVTGSMSAGFVVTMTGVSGAVELMTITSNSMVDSGGDAVDGTIVTKRIGVAANSETLAEGIARTQDMVQYFGILSAEIEVSASLLAAAEAVQALNKILFVSSKTAADVDPGGLLDLLATGSYTQTRGLLYVQDSLDSDALKMGAAYAGRALSTVFSGSNTTQTMHLKDLIGIQPDAGITQTILEKCKTAGADVYISLQGVSKVFCTGGNTFFDRVYNQQWLVAALQTAGFNAMAQASTKLPQTEQGVGVLKAAYRTVCEQAVANQYIAPGTWTSGDTFGNLEDFDRNISERGYYIYSSPVATQLQADREAREAPLIQIAVKEAGAIQSSNVLIFVNA